MASLSIFTALPASISGSTGRVGRPAKAGERYPSGKLKPTIRVSGPAPAEIRRVVDLAKRRAADPILATAVGWLRLHNILTDIDVSAALAYAKQKTQYDQVMGVPRRTATSMNYETGIGRTAAPPIDTEERQKYVAGVRRRYAALLNCLGNAKQRELLDRVCLDDEHLQLGS